MMGVGVGVNITLSPSAKAPPWGPLRQRSTAVLLGSDVFLGHPDFQPYLPFCLPLVPCLLTISKHFHSAIREACINIKYLYAVIVMQDFALE